MYEPLVSVYITSHNYENYLEGAIKSALNQTYKNIEIIIFDDNSADNSPEVINKYLSYPNVQAILSKESNGLRKACNICIANANGEFVIRLDADDILHVLSHELMQINKIGVSGVSSRCMKYYWLKSVNYHDKHEMWYYNDKWLYINKRGSYSFDW